MVGDVLSFLLKHITLLLLHDERGVNDRLVIFNAFPELLSETVCRPGFRMFVSCVPPFLSHLFQRPLLPFHLHFLYPCKCKRSAVLVAYTLLDIDNLSSVSVESATQFSTQQFVHTLARLFLQGEKIDPSAHRRSTSASNRLREF